MMSPSPIPARRMRGSKHSFTTSGLLGAMGISWEASSAEEPPKHSPKVSITCLALASPATCALDLEQMLPVSPASFVMPAEHSCVPQGLARTGSEHLQNGGAAHIHPETDPGEPAV